MSALFPQLSGKHNKNAEGRHIAHQEKGQAKQQRTAHRQFVTYRFTPHDPTGKEHETQTAKGQHDTRGQEVDDAKEIEPLRSTPLVEMKNTVFVHEKLGLLPDIEGENRTQPAKPE